jgi:hypothetical protein
VRQGVGSSTRFQLFNKGGILFLGVGIVEELLNNSGMAEWLKQQFAKL